MRVGPLDPLETSNKNMPKKTDKLVKASKIIEEVAAKDTDTNIARVDNRVRVGERRTNVDRSAETRERIIDATVRRLYKFGYSAATMSAISDEAGVTRGAIIHHFANMNELMIAVALHISENQFGINQQALAEMRPGRERFLGIIDTEWDTALAPSTIALLKILVESANNEVLSLRLPQIQLETEKRYRKMYVEIAREAGITDEAAIGSMFQLHICTTRGLAMTYMAGADIERSRSGFQLLKDFQNRLFDQYSSIK